jgi:hypothetical protein
VVARLDSGQNPVQVGEKPIEFGRACTAWVRGSIDVEHALLLVRAVCRQPVAQGHPARRRLQITLCVDAAGSPPDAGRSGRTPHRL